MKQIKVTIEEHLSKTITLQLPDNLTSPSDQIDYTIDTIKKLYQNQQIILDSLDYNGTTLIKLTDEDPNSQTNISTNWTEL